MTTESAPTETRKSLGDEPYRIGYTIDTSRWFVRDARTDEVVKEYRGKDAREHAIAYADQMNDEARRWGL